VWLFRGLVLLGLAMIVVSWFNVWWRADITMLGDNWTQIRPYALEMDPFIKGYLPSARLPDWIPPFVWTFFAVVVACMVLGMFVKEKVLGFGFFKFPLPTWLICGVGVAFIVCAVTMAVYASVEMGKFFGMQLVGDQYLLVDPDTSSYSMVYAKFMPGYYLAYVAGLYCIVLGLLSGRIKGNKRAPVQ
jgi:hypothetical protein